MSVNPAPKEGERFDLVTYDGVQTQSPKFSFGGLNNRFQRIKLPICQLTGYDLPATKSPRACSFGKGDRFSKATP